MLGCVCAEDYPGCHFCGVATYDPEFIEIGKLDWFFRAWWRVRQWFSKFERHKCENCRRKFWFGYNDHICSEECFDEWLPF